MDTDVNNASQPIEMADVVTPDSAGWKPAGRATAQKESPPPFFNLTPIEPVKEEEHSSSDAESTTKVATETDTETDSKTAPLAPVSRARLRSSELHRPRHPSKRKRSR